MSVPRRRFRRFVPGVTLLACLLPAANAWAHDPAGFYEFSYYASGNDDVPVYFDDDFPSGRAVDRVIDGAQQWTQLGRRMYFKVRTSPRVTSSADNAAVRCPTPEREGRRVGLVHWGGIDGPSGVVGATAVCFRNRESPQMAGFRVYFDRTENWYTGTGNSRVRNRRTGTVENRQDIWSIATHELGHATGWGPSHWRRSASYCDYSRSPEVFRTMCPFLDPGFERARTLAGADKHVFRSRYSAR